MKEKKGIINYEGVEDAIKGIEEFMKDYDVEEKLLIVKFVHQRIQQRIQQQKIKENVSNMDFKQIVKQVFKNKGNGEGD